MSLKTKRGDTILEVTIAITVFCIVSIISMGIMDRDLNSIQGALELEMTRNEIDSQAEALRFIHDSYLSEHEYTSKEYETLWKLLSHTSDNPESPGLVNNPASISPFSADQCSTYYDASAQAIGEPHNIFIDNAFVINTRDLNPSNLDNTIISTNNSPQTFISTPLYPRIVYTASQPDATNTDVSLVEGQDFIYNQVGSVEGVWVIATRDATDSENPALVNSVPEFFDYHIRSCWYPPNRSYPTTIATIIRLYNPDFEPIEGNN